MKIIIAFFSILLLCSCAGKQVIAFPQTDREVPAQDWWQHIAPGVYLCQETPANPQNRGTIYFFDLSAMGEKNLLILEKPSVQADFEISDQLVLEIAESQGIMLVLHSVSGGNEFHALPGGNGKVELHEIVNEVSIRSWKCQIANHSGIPPKSLLVLYDGEASSN